MPIQPLLTVIFMILMNLFQFKLQMTIQMIVLLLIIRIRMTAFLFGILVKMSKLYYQRKIRLHHHHHHRHGQNPWETVTVLGCAGSRKGKYKNWLNITNDSEQYSVDSTDIDKWQLVEHPQDPKIAEQCVNSENETDPLSSCDPLPKKLQEMNFDDTNESNDSHKGQYFDLNEVDDVFITYQQNSEEFHSAKIEELTKWKSLGVCTEVDDIGQNRITGRWVYTWKMINGKLIPKAR